MNYLDSLPIEIVDYIYLIIKINAIKLIQKTFRTNRPTLHSIYNYCVGNRVLFITKNNNIKFGTIVRTWRSFRNHNRPYIYKIESLPYIKKNTINFINFMSVQNPPVFLSEIKNMFCHHINNQQYFEHLLSEDNSCEDAFCDIYNTSKYYLAPSCSPKHPNSLVKKVIKLSDWKCENWSLSPQSINSNIRMYNKYLNKSDIINHIKYEMKCAHWNNYEINCISRSTNENIEWKSYVLCRLITMGLDKTIHSELIY